ncbi:MAG: HEPN domain-containing protein [Archaeoglobaceae archaeon]
MLTFRKDWIDQDQAKRDLKVAEGMMKAEAFEWTCFIAQQAAEKGVKSVFQKLSATAWGEGCGGCTPL